MAEQAKKKNSLSREEAAALYEDLRKNFAAFSGEKTAAAKAAPKTYMKPVTRNTVTKKPVSPVSAASAYKRPVDPYQAQEDAIAAAIQRGLSRKQGGFGAKLAVSTLVLAAALKFTISVCEYTGILEVPNAVASIGSSLNKNIPAEIQNLNAEQIALLKTLDSRRVELEERRKTLDKRESEANNRDKEFAIKLAELRELTNVLKNSREADGKKKTAQLDQLSNVYGSMDPKEAALLIEQLDDAIAIELLNRMAEKRIGQILALMNKEKALTMTKMLSGKHS